MRISMFCQSVRFAPARVGCTLGNSKAGAAATPLPHDTYDDNDSESDNENDNDDNNDDDNNIDSDNDDHENVENPEKMRKTKNPFGFHSECFS